jgi:hypothetical protein
MIKQFFYPTTAAKGDLVIVNHDTHAICTLYHDARADKIFGGQLAVLNHYDIAIVVDLIKSTDEHYLKNNEHVIKVLSFNGICGWTWRGHMKILSTVQA